jgi:hypothetical protein
MKKKTNIRTMIRQIVREEVGMAINEVIAELNKPVEEMLSIKKPKSNISEKKTFTSNSVLNDVLNETAVSDEWKTLGGGKLDSSQMNNVISQNYGDMMNSNPNTPVTVNGQTPDFLKKDYRALMKAVDKKQGK